MNEFAREQWWLAALGPTLVWARMRVLESGSARVLDCDGNDLAYDSEDSARAALMDADFLAIDGMDEADADQLGVDLATLAPPRAGNDEALRALMIQQRPSSH